MEYLLDRVKTFRVYVLRDCNGVIFYVGVTHNNIQDRFCQHISLTRLAVKRGRPLNELQQRIVREGFNISMEVVDIVNTREGGMSAGNRLENKWIVRLVSEGHKLLNKQNARNNTKDYVGKVIKVP